jgi:hypothetical protein
LCVKCGGVTNDAYSYIDYLFQLTLEGWDIQDKMDITGVKKAGILFPLVYVVLPLLLGAFAFLCDELYYSWQLCCVACR